MKLNYLSARAAGYLSMLRILLTPPSPLSPVSPLGGLSKVHVRASVEGRLYQRWYPAGPGLVHRLVWNKTDVYGQEVWGLTHATGRYSVKHKGQKTERTTTKQLEHPNVSEEKWVGED